MVIGYRNGGVLVSKPKGLKDSGSKSLTQWICREWALKLGFNGSYNTHSGLKILRKQRKTSSRKFFLDEVWGEWFLNIILLDLDTISVLVVTMCSLQIPPLEGLLHYITPFRWSWPSICWSSRSLPECLSHQTPSQAPYELEQPIQHCSRVFSTCSQEVWWDVLIWWQPPSLRSCQD